MAAKNILKMIRRESGELQDGDLELDHYESSPPAIKVSLGLVSLSSPSTSLSFT